MAFTFGFYNSLAGDRKYNAKQISAILDGLVNDGIYASKGNLFATTPGNGMQVLVDTGRAWLNQTWNDNDAPFPINLPSSDPIFSRYYAICIEVNAADDVRTNRLMSVQGLLGSNPVKPELLKSETLNQWPLAYVLVPPAATQINPSMIEVVVGRSEMPFVTGIIQTASIDSLFQQWDGQFNEWWDTIKATLDENIVTNLQNQIDARVKIADLATEQEASLAQNNTKWMSPLRVGQAISVNWQKIRFMTVRIVNEAGNPIKGATVNGLKNLLSGSLTQTTLADGIIGGMLQDSGMITVSGFDDKKDVTVDVSSGLGSSYGDVLYPKRTSSYSDVLRVTSSRTVKFSENLKTINLCLVGGGGGGGNATQTGGYQQSAVNGGGGGGGAIVNEMNVPITATRSFSAIIAGAAGTTTFMEKSAAGGGNGGNADGGGVQGATINGTAGIAAIPGSGAGGSGGQPGGAAILYAFNDSGYPEKFGGGGGGGRASAYMTGGSTDPGALLGGAPNGANGASAWGTTSGGGIYGGVNATTPKGPGGGGGGAARVPGTNGLGALSAGAPGILLIQFILAE